MKKIILLTAMVSLGAYVSRAQDAVVTAASLEDNFRNTLWYNSTNGAGMAFDSLAIYSTLDLGGSLTSGDWKRAKESSRRTQIDAHTSGTANVGKFRVMGDFAFRDIFDRESMFNTLTYDVTDDMPYYVLDTMSSPWSRQEYEMSAMLISPAINDRISAACEVHYTTRVGAKQKDPRSEGYVMDIELKPSMALRLSDSNILGVAALFDYTYEFSEPTNVNYSYDQKVFLMRGLGEGDLKKVGGNDGLPNVFSKSYRFGASVQYSRFGKGLRQLVDLYGRYGTVDVEQQTSLPRSMGATNQILAGLKYQLMFGYNWSDKISFNAFYRNTGGLEKIQKRDDTAFKQQWVTVGTNRMVEMNRIEASVEYDHRLNTSALGGYSWDFGADAGFEMESDSYLSPQASLDWMRAYASAFAMGQFDLGGSPLRARIDAGYGMAFSGAYSPSTTSKDVPQRVYKEDIKYLTDNYAKLSAMVDYTLVRGTMGYRFALTGGYAMPLGQNDVRLMYGDVRKGLDRINTKFIFALIF